MADDPRDGAAAAISLAERANQAEEWLYITRGQLRKVVDAYDRFVDAESVAPLVEAVKGARNWLTLLDEVNKS